jgi:hypothetical protein
LAQPELVWSQQISDDDHAGSPGWAFAFCGEIGSLRAGFEKFKLEKFKLEKVKVGCPTSRRSCEKWEFR